MIEIIFGMQYGSEGKGSVSSWLARRKMYDLVIRTGSVNAGHTFMDEDGYTYKMRQLPCSWAFQDTPIYIPAGAVVDVSVLRGELDLLLVNGYKGTVYVSPDCAVITEGAKAEQRMIGTGTTGVGVGATRARKLMRRATLWKDVVFDHPLLNNDVRYPCHIIQNNADARIMIETTQGFGLSNDWFQPFCCSSNLTIHRFLDDAEVPFGLHSVFSWGVMRPFPIRIAGNSGHLKGETTWEELQKKYGKHIPIEITTVTKKVRRVGQFDAELVKKAIRMNQPSRVVLAFVDYLFPNIEETGVTAEVELYVESIQKEINREIDFLGIGIGKLIRARSENERACVKVIKSQSLEKAGGE